MLGSWWKDLLDHCCTIDGLTMLGSDVSLALNRVKLPSSEHMLIFLRSRCGTFGPYLSQVFMHVDGVYVCTFVRLCSCVCVCVYLRVSLLLCLCLYVRDCFCVCVCM